MLEGIIWLDDIDYKRAVEKRPVGALYACEGVCDQRGAKVKEVNKQGYLFSECGIHCPLCGGRMARGSLFCGHCSRAGRFHIDAKKVQVVTKEIHLPRAINRHHLRHSA